MKYQQKYLLTIIVIVVSICSLYAQTYGNELKALKIGDKVPDIPLGEVINNYTGKTKLSQFKGKLLILDFWSTTCSNCIEAFPKLAELQHKFAGKIQIILVDVYETKERVLRRLDDIRKYNPKLFIPDLPSVVNAKQFKELFPPKYVDDLLGQHVWIDQQGIVRAITFEFSTYEQKIEDFLKGKKLSFLHAPASRPWFDKNKPYWQLLTGPDQSKQLVVFNLSYFNRYDDNYSPINGSYINDVQDSVLETVRDTYVNVNALVLYYSVFREAIQKNLARIITGGPRSAKYPSTSWMDFFLLKVEDTSKYTDLYIPSHDISDSAFIKSKYCYEQIMPSQIRPEARRDVMLDNLNKYFGKLYGATGKLQKIKVPCYVLVRTSSEDKVSTTNDYAPEQRFSDNGQPRIKIITNSVQQAIQQAIANSPVDNYLKSTVNGLPQFLVDETDFKTDKVEMIFPEKTNLKTIDDLRIALKPYDLDIRPAEKEIEFIEIDEN